MLTDSSPVVVAMLATIPVYLIIASGWFARRLRWLEQEHETGMMKVAIDLCYPCLVLSSMMGNEQLRNPAFTLTAVGAGFSTVAVGMGVAWCVAKVMGMQVGTGLRTFSLSAGVQNYGFFIIPIVAVLYPAQDSPMMGILMTHNTGCEIAVWTIGVLILAGGMRQVSPSLFLRGPLVAVLLGLLIVWTRADHYIAIPPVMQTLRMLGACTIPLCVFLFGTTMYDSWKFIKWDVKPLISGVVVRLGIVPLLILTLAYFLPVDVSIKQIMVLQSAIPAAMLPVLMARQFGGHPALALQITLVTTMLSFLTLPLWLMFGFYWLFRR